jgi:hypothetical protein
MKAVSVCVVLGALTIPVAAFAQNTFGEFLDMGAVPVTKAEWETLLPASKSGKTAQGSDVTLEYAPGGKLSGNITLAAGHKSKVRGTWTVDETGNLCIEEYFEAWAQTWKDCGRLYRLNGKYYRMVDVTDRAAKLSKTSHTVPFNVKK